MNAATVALIDQAQAATDHSTYAMRATALRINGRFFNVRPGPITNAFTRDLYNRIATRRVELCPHINPRRPEPAMWAPWAPGRVRCLPCGEKAAKRIAGTSESFRCDHCHRISPRCTGIAVQFPAIVVDIPDADPLALPPINLQYGTCGTCYQREIAGQKAA